MDPLRGPSSSSNGVGIWYCQRYARRHYLPTLSDHLIDQSLACLLVSSKKLRIHFCYDAAGCEMYCLEASKERPDTAYLRIFVARMIHRRHLSVLGHINFNGDEQALRGQLNCIVKPLFGNHN